MRAIASVALGSKRPGVMVPYEARVVLDLCTGDGSSLGGLRQPGRLVIGLDTSFGMLEHAGRLHVIDGALGAGIDRVIVNHQVDRASVDLRGAHDDAVRRADHAAHGRSGKSAIFDEAVRIGQGGDALARRPSAALALLRHRLGPGGIEAGGAAVEDALQVGPQRPHGRGLGHGNGALTETVLA